MEKKKRRITIFVGYQINSDYHASKDLKDAIFQVKKIIENQIPNIDLDIKFGEFEAGRILWDEVFNTIKKCDVAIFDISENNPNVLIEVGLAYGNNKHVILLKNEISVIVNPIPHT